MTAYPSHGALHGFIPTDDVLRYWRSRGVPLFPAVGPLRTIVFFCEYFRGSIQEARLLAKSRDFKWYTTLYGPLHVLAVMLHELPLKMNLLKKSRIECNSLLFNSFLPHKL